MNSLIMGIASFVCQKVHSLFWKEHSVNQQLFKTYYIPSCQAVKAAYHDPCSYGLGCVGSIPNSQIVLCFCR